MSMRPRQSSARASGSEAITETVWGELRDPLLGFIARRVPTPHDAEDILQDVLLRIHRHAEELERVDRFASWAYRIATNSIADHYRRPIRREMPFGHAEDVPAPHRPIDSDGRDPRTQLAGCVRPLIANLPDPYRQAVELTELHGVTQAEAATRLGLSVSGMKSRVQRGRDQLKDLMLDCCAVELDSRGTVSDVTPRHAACATCAADETQSASF
ncbi:MAG TPA: sigma-70 family RNA polymerase sigma factor [Thermoleophilaceae bacterium]